MKKENIHIKKNNKILLITLGTIIGISIIVGIVLAFIINYNTNAPKEVEIIKNERTTFYVEANDSYKGYRFKFSSANQELVFDSLSNVIVMEELEGFIPGQKYEVSACYLAETEGANSDFSSPVSWVCYVRLDCPDISFKQEDGIISWDEIKNADYYSVVIYTKTGLIQEKALSNFYDLNNINGGIYQISVSSNSNKSYYEQSMFSEKLEVTFIKKFKPFDSAVLNYDTGTLVIKGSQQISRVNIKIDYKVSEGYSVNYKKEGENYIYEIDLLSSPFAFTKSSVIEVSPSSLVEFNLYSGEPTTVTIK